MEARPVPRELVPLHLERAAGLELAVDEDPRPGNEALGKPCLVEPDRGRPAALPVHDRGLDELQVAAARRSEARALDRALDGRLLSEPKGGEPSRFRPVQEVARDVLDKVTDRLDTECREPLGNLRADAGERADGGLFVHSEPRLRRAWVHASKAGQRWAQTHGEGQDVASIRLAPDVTRARVRHTS